VSEDNHVGLGLWRLMSLSTIFQIYHGSYNWKKCVNVLFNRIKIYIYLSMTNKLIDRVK
jgi:hypothetical protein